jgi:hypothetical protein
MIDPATDWWDEKSPEELATIVANNREAIEIARRVFDNPCVASIDWNGASSPAALQTEMDRAQSLRSLYRALLAIRRQAVLSGNIPAAAEASLDLARLAAVAPRGGLLVDHQIGWAYRSAAARDLYQLAGQFDAIQCRDVAEQWSRIEWPEETVEELFQRDQYFMQQSQGMTDGISRVLHAITYAKLAAPAVKAMHDAHRRVLAEDGLLRTRLAIRQFELAEDRLPDSLEELAPKYLAGVLGDPFVDGPLQFHPQPVGGFLLYSVGANRIDDGGAPHPLPDQGDVTLSEESE